MANRVIFLTKYFPKILKIPKKYTRHLSTIDLLSLWNKLPPGSLHWETNKHS